MSQCTDRSHCSYRIHLIERSFHGRITIIDTVVDRSGVGVYVDNEELGESYDTYSDTLVALYREGRLSIGDEVLKNSNTRYGYVLRSNGERMHVPLLNARVACDTLSKEERDGLKRRFPVDFTE